MEYDIFYTQKLDYPPIVRSEPTPVHNLAVEMAPDCNSVLTCVYTG